MIHGLNHFTVITQELDRTLEFYGALGLQQGPRPDFGFAGAWLYAGGKPILHIYADRPVPPAGVIDHMAFSARNLREVKGRLDGLGIKYDLRQLKGGGAWQLFCHDPNGAKVELDFDPGEAP